MTISLPYHVWSIHLPANESGPVLTFSDSYSSGSIICTGCSVDRKGMRYFKWFRPIAIKTKYRGNLYFLISFCQYKNISSIYFSDKRKWHNELNFWRKNKSLYIFCKYKSPVITIGLEGNVYTVFYSIFVDQVKTIFFVFIFFYIWDYCSQQTSSYLQVDCCGPNSRSS